MTPPGRIEEVEKGSRIAAVDGLRGMLALVVVAWHIAGPLGATWLLIPANLAVALFFVLSGYVLTRGWNGRFGLFLVRRFIRLWPVYALCLAAGYLIAGIHPVWSEFLWYPIIDANTKPFIDPPIWSLFLEAWAMPFMPLIIWAGSGPTMRAALCMFVLILAALAIPEISVGVLFVAGAFLARSRFRSRYFESAVPQWFGRISYSLYLTHWLVLTLATRVFGPWSAIAALPVVFLVAWLVWWGVERPSIWASRLAGRAAGAALDRFSATRRTKMAPVPSGQRRALPEIQV